MYNLFKIIQSANFSKVRQKIKAVLYYKKYLTIKSIKLKHLKVEPMFRNLCILAAQIMTSYEKKIEKAKIYYEQYLCKLYYLDD